MLIKGVKVSPLVVGVKGTFKGENVLLFNNILNDFGKKKINLLFIVQVKNSEDLTSITLCLNSDDFEEAEPIIRNIYPDITISILPSLNIVSVFPFRNNPEVALLFLKVLEDNSIPVLAVNTSLSSISCLVHHKHCLLAQVSLTKTFGIK